MIHIYENYKKSWRAKPRRINLEGIEIIAIISHFLIDNPDTCSVSRPNASGQVRKLSQGLDIALKKALSERLLERDISVRENLDAIVGLVPVDVADPRNYTNMKPESPVGEF